MTLRPHLLRYKGKFRKNYLIQISKKNFLLENENFVKISFFVNFKENQISNFHYSNGYILEDFTPKCNKMSFKLTSLLPHVISLIPNMNQAVLITPNFSTFFFYNFKKIYKENWKNFFWDFLFWSRYFISFSGEKL